MIRLALAFATLAALCARAIPSEAQAAAPPVVAAHVDTLVHRLAIDSTRLQPGRFVYRSVLLRDSSTTMLGDQQFIITSMDYAGTPAWLLARDGAQGIAMASDSLVVRRADLQPLHWTATLGAARLAAEFTPDTVFGAMTSPLGKQTLIFPNRPDLLVNPMAVDELFAALPLATGWRDSASVLVVDPGGMAIAPATMEVEGEEHVAVPAGEYDCWIVSLDTERGAERLWVSKQGQLVIRADQILPQLGGAILQRTLVQTDSATAPPPSPGVPR